jgi:transaldolase
VPLKLYLDSAQETEASQVRDWGWVAGVTTNPILMAQAGGLVNLILERLAAFGFAELFYQLVARDWEGMLREAETASQLVGKPLVLKVPPSDLGFRFAAQHSSVYPCCVTAIYSPAQALVARAAGAQYIAVYVNRATRLLGNGAGLVSEVAKVLAGSETEIIAASLKSPEEATAALLAGAQHLTLPFSVLTALPVHALSVETLSQFEADGKGLEANP